MTTSRLNDEEDNKNIDPVYDDNHKAKTAVFSAYDRDLKAISDLIINVKPHVNYNKVSLSQVVRAAIHIASEVDIEEFATVIHLLRR